MEGYSGIILVSIVVRYLLQNGSIVRIVYEGVFYSRVKTSFTIFNCSSNLFIEITNEYFENLRLFINPLSRPKIS